MFQKDMKISLLLDFYGELLSEHKREAIELYYDDDLSLAEIAEQMDISRQGVRDLIKKGEAQLTEYEEKLGLARRFSDLGDAINAASKEIYRIASEEDDRSRAERLENIAKTLTGLSI